MDSLSCKTCEQMYTGETKKRLDEDTIRMKDFVNNRNDITVHIVGRGALMSRDVRKFLAFLCGQRFMKGVFHADCKTFGGCRDRFGANRSDRRAYR